MVVHSETSKGKVFVAYNAGLCRPYGTHQSLENLIKMIEKDKFGPGIDFTVIFEMSDADARSAMDPMMNHRNGLTWAYACGGVVFDGTKRAIQTTRT